MPVPFNQPHQADFPEAMQSVSLLHHLASLPHLRDGDGGGARKIIRYFPYKQPRIPPVEPARLLTHIGPLLARLLCPASAWV